MSAFLFANSAKWEGFLSNREINKNNATFETTKLLPWSAVRSLKVYGERAQAAVRGEAEGGARVKYLSSGV